MKNVIQRRFRSSLLSSPRVQNGSSATFALLLLLLCLHSNAHAQFLDTQPWPATQTVDLVVGWDFSGMSATQEEAFWAIMNPPTDEEIERNLTPDQVVARHQARLIITQPEPHTNPVQLSPDQQADLNVKLWLISHPFEAAEIMKQGKSQEQLTQEAAAQWMMLHPVEAFQLSQRSLTPDQLAAQVVAIMEAIDTTKKPKPIIKTLPIGEASALLNEPKP